MVLTMSHSLDHETMRMRLNGWYRNGVVVSIFWFIGFVGYEWFYRWLPLSEWNTNCLHVDDVSDEDMGQAFKG